MNINRWIKENWCPLILTLVTVSVGTFMGVHCACSLPNTQVNAYKIDTVYIERSITDSLLLDISSQIYKINEQLQRKKVYTQERRSIICDTLKIDASIHIDRP